MTTKFKSPLLSIITIAVVLFISAIIWKNTSIDNSEKIYVAPIKVEKPTVKHQRKVIEDTYDMESTSTYDPEPSSTDELVNASNVDEKIKVLEKKLNMHIMLKTPEDVLKVIESYQSAGNDSEAQRYIDFLVERFPDFDY